MKTETKSLIYIVIAFLLYATSEYVVDSTTKDGSQPPQLIGNH